MRAIAGIIMSPPGPDGIAARRGGIRPPPRAVMEYTMYLKGARRPDPSLGVELMPSTGLDGNRRSPIIGALALAAGFVTWLGSAADDGPRPGKAKSTRPPRVPWTTSRVVGSPDPPPPFKVVRAFPNLKFDHPLLIARYLGGDRLVVGEQS